MVGLTIVDYIVDPKSRPVWLLWCLCIKLAYLMHVSLSDLAVKPISSVAFASVFTWGQLRPHLPPAMPDLVGYPLTHERTNSKSEVTHYLVVAPLTVLRLFPHNPNLKFSHPETSSLIFPCWCPEIAHCWSPNSGANIINCGEGLAWKSCLAACLNECSVARHIAQMLPCPTETSDWMIVVFSLSKHDKNVFQRRPLVVTIFFYFL